ncbi:RNA polymerase sigma-70 factor, ECF subfamily [Evansella caseinilytica]|uniref:RNA polymerase sigma factor n=1 Tax=Evansella caseinilytica TaxID=1503961 RepID=A0A1H3UYP3_9BACI|nr:sigma-70 family RNA polymerase sigma factor [Evansella caseinilytica]SDZ67562.1 RNA polymerase sigma-70 factor, ECF subfamily [Evansella caseinilytica]
MDLIERLRNKEEDALRELMNRFGDMLLRTAILLVKDPHVAEEVVQDTFIAAFQKINQLHDKDKLKSWLVKITMNGCRARMRTWTWKHIFVYKDGDEVGGVADDGLRPEELAEIAFRNSNLHAAIQQLPYKYREVVALYYFHELSVREIGNMLSAKESTVKTRLARGRHHLKQRLQTGGETIGPTAAAKGYQ